MFEFHISEDQFFHEFSCKGAFECPEALKWASQAPFQVLFLKHARNAFN